MQYIYDPLAKNVTFFLNSRVLARAERKHQQERLFDSCVPRQTRKRRAVSRYTRIGKGYL